MKRVYLAAAGLAALSTAAPAAAQQAPEPDVAGRAGASAVSEVVVTATRTPQPIERIGAAVTVLTKAEIEAGQAVTAVDLLAATPALNYVRNGGPGTAATVNIRGAEGQHTVVLIDGVKLNDPASTQGAFNFGNLLIGDVARVEVLRGAHSTLWGSQAVGGVVNIVTARPEAPFET
ncbi:MAG: TonB-dependent receptor, partial [Pseudomonadota bacterium]